MAIPESIRSQRGRWVDLKLPLDVPLLVKPPIRGGECNLSRLGSSSTTKFKTNTIRSYFIRTGVSVSTVKKSNAGSNKKSSSAVPVLEVRKLDEAGD
ncbi:hypothetical protein C5167_046808 [Papaver somniferum]|uniref:Multiprotein bridging factor 1 N-terminal domain-containing protein n=1 Tax=Papaver somniferum TaxID=3469 RepID=A0A4Y7LIE3_PAPSO|nr:hypothetical protein C5167_046808 [Papaver somniferum]